MDAFSLSIPNSEPPIVAKLRQGPFDDPPVPPQPRAGVDALSGDPARDPLPGRGRRIGRTPSISSSKTVLSWKLAPVTRDASEGLCGHRQDGAWCLLSPDLPGSGRWQAPPFLKTDNWNRLSRPTCGANQSGRPGQSDPEEPSRAVPIHWPLASRAVGVSKSCHSRSSSLGEAPPTGCRF